MVRLSNTNKLVKHATINIRNINFYRKARRGRYSNNHNLIIDHSRVIVCYYRGVAGGSYYPVGKD